MALSQASNTLVTATVVAKRAVQMLVNELQVANLVHRQYVKEFTGNRRTGGTVTILAPMYARVKSGATLDQVDLKERSFILSATTRKHVAHALSSEEMTYNLEGWEERIIKPAMVALANKIEIDVLANAKKFPQQVGTPGTTPSNFSVLGDAYALMTEMGCPNDGLRRCFVGPRVTAALSDHLKAIYHRDIVGNAVTRAKLPPMAGFDMYESNNIYTHANGSGATSTDAVNQPTPLSEGDTSIDIDGAASASSTLKVGDLFTVASCYAVNPVSGQSTGQLRQFVVDATATASSSAYTGIKTTPGTSPNQMYSASATEKVLPYQNMDALPADGGVVTYAGSASQSYPLNLAFHRDAMALVTVPLEMPDSISWKARESYKGVSLRVVKDYQVEYDQEFIRFDILYGTDVLDRALGCRICG